MVVLEVILLFEAAEATSVPARDEDEAARVLIAGCRVVASAKEGGCLGELRLEVLALGRVRVRRMFSVGASVVTTLRVLVTALIGRKDEGGERESGTALVAALIGVPLGML